MIGPKILPGTWQPIASPMPGGECYRHQSGMVVILTVDQRGEGPRWLHVSCSRRGRLPSWDDLKMVKAVFIGPDKEAFQVLPPDAEYVNLHLNALHLWHSLDGRRIQEL